MNANRRAAVRRERAMKRIVVAHFILLSCCVTTQARTVNLEGSEALEQAQQCDPFDTTKDREQLDRATAIAFYEQYLREYPQSFNRPKVLAEIGLLYLYVIDPEKGYERELDKATVYLEQAIQADPELICEETILARTNWSSASRDRQERIRRGPKTYKWFSDVSDEMIRQSLEREEAHQMRQPSEGFTYRTLTEEEREAALQKEVELFRKRVDGCAESTGRYLLGDALGSRDPQSELEKLIRELDGYPLAERARAELAKVRQERVARTVEPVVERILSGDSDLDPHSASATFERPGEGDRPSSQPQEALQENIIGNAVAVPVTAVPSAAAPAPPADTFTRRLAVWTCAIVGLAAAASLFLWIRRRTANAA